MGFLEEEEKRKRGRQDNQKMKAYLVMRLLQKETKFDHLLKSLNKKRIAFLHNENTPNLILFT